MWIIVPFHIWDVILPIDELILIKMVKTVKTINQINTQMFVNGGNSAPSPRTAGRKGREGAVLGIFNPYLGGSRTIANVGL